jgi:hypothetical protein
MIKIEYWNSYDILDIHYEGSYKNRFWLNVETVKPDYPIYREAVEDSYNDSHNTFLKWEKQYSFELYCMENILDMLSMLTLHDNVWITLENGYSGKVRDFFITIEWTSVKSVAKVTCTFTVKSYIINGASATHC